MNILLLNTYRHGGAGVAARRLQAALNAEAGVRADLLSASDAGSRWPFYAERLSFLPFERDASVRFSFSLANFGHDLRKLPLVRQADVLHLHWINQGMLSLKQISQLAALGKPLVWTLHDMWPFTGGCHYSGACMAYRSGCGNCPYLRSPGPNDLSSRILARKATLFPPDMQFVTCSRWLAQTAISSSLLAQSTIRAIPNPIDTALFHPLPEDQRQAFRRQVGIQPGAQVLLFVAMNVKEERKGFGYLKEALHYLKQSNPGLPLELLVMGKCGPDLVEGLPYPAHLLGMLSQQEDLLQAYGSADVFVIPSLEDNLPNTVMESLACGTPVAGFATGGIPEMVEHDLQGQIAPQRDSRSLAEGIARILSDPGQMRENARRKVLETYANKVVARQYLDLYRSLL
jgi:glycosyltransferase involved in cell wall biosynthesis